MRTFVIVNPQSRGGKTARDADVIVKALRRELGDVTIAMTARPGEATALAREALRSGYERIVAVGGDGTTNEVVNGFFVDDVPINPDATLGIVPSGTGGDFRRTLGIASAYAASTVQLRDATARAVDVGHVRFMTAHGVPGQRYFLNIASFGLSGDVVERRERSRLRQVGGPLSYVCSSLAAIVGLRATDLRITVDDHPALCGPLLIGAVCNGRYFGGGMNVAPNATPDDGLFDVVLLRGTSRLGVLARMTELYRGTHVAHETVHVVRGRSVVVETTTHPGAAVRLEIDGEGGALLPASFSIKTHALRVHR